MHRFGGKDKSFNITIKRAARLPSPKDKFLRKLIQLERGISTLQLRAKKKRMEAKSKNVATSNAKRLRNSFFASVKLLSIATWSA